jgi:hypothetical protein
MFDDRIDAVGLDDRSITESHNEVLDARYDRNGLAEFEALRSRTVIQDQLRGTLRFGYSDREENFRFVAPGIPFVSDPGPAGAVRCTAHRVLGQRY